MTLFRPLLVILAYLLTFFLFVRAFKLSILEADWRFSALAAFVVIGALIWLSSEFLSALNQLTSVGLLAIWMTVIITLLAFRKRKLLIPRTEISQVRSWPLWNHFKSFSELSVWLPLYVALVIGVLVIIAVMAAPNNWDSMTYHLSRVMHWQQNRNINFFPTNNLRQLHAGPWAEMAILQLQLLAGSDRLANSVQFFALIGSLVGVSYIAKLLGGSKKSQILAILFTITIPMGILQSTSTQNDYVVGFWLVCFTVFLLMGIKLGPSFLFSILCGASLGLAVLTKATAAVFATPLFFLIGFDMLRRYDVSIWKTALVVLLTALVINSGHFTRNYHLYGNPLGPLSESPDGTKSNYTNEIYSVPAFASNLLRNSALHLGSPIPSMNANLQNTISRIHDWLGIDAMDQHTTWTGSVFSVTFALDEDTAGNPIHFVLIILSLILIPLHRNSRVALFGVCVAAGFVLFSLVLKWQPWHSRLHLPFFILSAPFVAIIMMNTFSLRSISIIMIIFALYSIPYIVTNPSRPLIGPNSVLSSDRKYQYFRTRPELVTPYHKAVNLLESVSCSEVGLITGGDDWEYPIWVMSGADKGHLRIEHIKVDNISRSIFQEFTPCVILSTINEPIQEIFIYGNEYVQIFYDAPISVFISSKSSIR